MEKLKTALVQMGVSDVKEENIAKAEEMTAQAARAGAQLVVLPEMFNCPYVASNFPEYAEKEGGYTWQRLSRLAQEQQVYLVGGSIPEVDEQAQVYNTCFVFDREGRQIAKHRKMHLFDIDVKGGQTFKESETLSPGNTVNVFDTPYGKMGIVICYDLRFPEICRLLVQQGAKFIIVPAAFNMTTGPAHWELLFRARALDNQVYVIGAAPARNYNSSYVSYANSLVVDPWGRITTKLGEEEKILIADLDLELINKVRNELPLLKHLRKDIYKLETL